MECIRIIEFDAGHRVVGHEGKCKFLHGHRYKVHAKFKARELDLLGRVVDFGIIKQKLGGWIDHNLDHTCILWTKDERLGKVVAAETKQEIYYMDVNPTAENIAKHILYDIIPTLFSDKDGLICQSITLFETPNCYVIVGKE